MYESVAILDNHSDTLPCGWHGQPLTSGQINFLHCKILCFALISISTRQSRANELSKWDFRPNSPYGFRLLGHTMMSDIFRSVSRLQKLFIHRSCSHHSFHCLWCLFVFLNTSIFLSFTTFCFSRWKMIFKRHDLRHINFFSSLVIKAKLHNDWEITSEWQ